MLNEIIGFGAVHGGQIGFLLGESGGELAVAAFHLLHALDQGRKPVCGFQQLALGIVQHTAGQVAAFDLMQLRRQQIHHGKGAFPFHGFVGGAQGFVLVFDRGRHIAGQNFRRIVVQRRGGHGVGADIGPGVGDVPGDQAKRMGQQGGIRRVLTQAFLPHAAHQRPPRNILHAPQKSVKRV